MKKTMIFPALLLTLIIMFDISRASFTLTCEIVMQAIPGDSTAFFEAQLTNTGDGRDGYVITKQNFLPETWFSFLCIDSLCLPGDSGQALLDPGGVSIIKPEIVPAMNPGDGEIIVTVQSIGDPSDIKQFAVRAVSGYTTLLVGGSIEEDQYKSFYQEALDSSGVAFNFWDLNFSPFRSSDLPYFEKILIYSGDRVSDILSADEITALSEFLAFNGKLFLTGQGLASSLQGSEFLENGLGVGFTATHQGSLEINGSSNDPIGHGLSFNASGGDGADNQVEADEIETRNGGIASFAYSSGATAGIRKASQGHASVFLAFGLEAIDNAADRIEVVDRVFTWFDQVTPVEENADIAQPSVVELISCYPNPFNSSASISYKLNAVSDVSIDIYNILGERVETIFDGSRQAGQHTIIWDASDYPSGVYFARINSPYASNNIKMTLIK